MRTVLVRRQFVKAPSRCSDVSIIGLMTRQIHAMDTAMPAFPPGDTKLCVNADSGTGVAAAEGDQECRGILVGRRRVVDDPDVGVLHQDGRGLVVVDGERDEGNRLDRLPQQVCEQRVQPWKGEAHDADLGQPQLLGKVDLREIKPGSAGVDVDARDDAERTEGAGVAEEYVKIDDIRCGRGQSGGFVERDRDREGRAHGDVDSQRAEDGGQQEVLGIEERAEQFLVRVLGPFHHQVVAVRLCTGHCSVLCFWGPLRRRHAR